MTAALATLALVLALGQNSETPAQAVEHGSPGEPAAAGHEGGGHDESLGGVMMHHVTDGYVVEHPGYCHGGLAWNCELDLQAAFGTTVDPATGAKSGPLVFGKLDMTPTKHVVMMWSASVLLLVALVGAAMIVRRRRDA